MAVAPGFCMQEEYVPIKRYELTAHILQNFEKSEENEKKSVEKVVHTILDRSFEKGRREVQSNNKESNFGYVFPTQPEIMYNLISFIQKFKEEKQKGPCVLEIGGAQGDNAIILGISGADYVVLNDLEEKEIFALLRPVKQVWELAF